MKKSIVSRFLIIFMFIIIMVSCSPEQELHEPSSQPDTHEFSSFAESQSDIGEPKDNSLAGELLKARQYLEAKDYAKAIEIYEFIPFSYAYNESEGSEMYAGLFEAYLSLQKYDLARDAILRGYDFLGHDYVESSIDRLNKLESENIFNQTGNYSTQSTLSVIDTSVPLDQREWKSWTLSGGGNRVTDNTFLWLAYWACTERDTFPQQEEGPLSVALRGKIEDLPRIGSVQRNVVSENWDVWSATEEFVIDLTGEVKPDIDFFYSVARSLGDISYWVQDSRRSTKVSFLLNGEPYPGIPIRDDGGIAHMIGIYTKEEFDAIRTQSPYSTKPVQHRAENDAKVVSTTEEIREMWEMLMTPEEFEILYPMCIHTGNPEKDKLLDFLNAYLEVDSSVPHEYLNGEMDDGLFRCILFAAPFIPMDSKFAEVLKQETHTSDAYYKTKENVETAAKRLVGENVAFLHHSIIDSKDWRYDPDLGVYSPFRGGGGSFDYFWHFVSYQKNENGEYIIEALSTQRTDELSSMNEETMERIRCLGDLPPEVRITLQDNNGELFIKQYEYLLSPQ